MARLGVEFQLCELRPLIRSTDLLADTCSTNWTMAHRIPTAGASHGIGANCDARCAAVVAAATVPETAI